jgi:hypothetical protein
MRIAKPGQANLWGALSRDVGVVGRIIALRKLDILITLVAIVCLMIFMNLLIMLATTRHVPSVTVNTRYFGPAVTHLASASPRTLPAALGETMGTYWEYPIVWFTFPRMSIAEQVRTLAMDATIAFPVISIRYLAEILPLALLLAIYTVLFRHSRRMAGDRQGQHVVQVASISLPGGTGAIGSAFAPMACCGSAAVQAGASVIGFSATATAALVLSKVSVGAVVAFLVFGIARSARSINAGCLGLTVRH